MDQPAFRIDRMNCAVKAEFAEVVEGSVCDERTLDSLLSLEQSPVGADGELRPGPGRDSLLEDPGTTTLFATVPLSSVQRFNGNS